MGRMTYEEAKQYENNSGLFILPDDGNKATIKVLIESMKDIYSYMIHYVKHNGQNKKIECRRSNLGESIEKCPLCEAGNRVAIRYFLPIWDFTEDMFKYWERGPKFKNKLITLCQNYYPVYDEVFQIERIGVAGDQNTNYEFENITDRFLKDNPDEDINFTLEDLDVPDVFDETANIVLVKSNEEIEYYLQHGKFEDDTFTYQDEQPARRSGSKRDSEDEGNNYQSRRGGYSTRRRDNEDSEKGGYQSRTNRRRDF
jgi:hypothetical protein